MTAKKKLPVGILNILSSLLLQLFTIANGFILPRILLQTFGSETNGLISSLCQFLNYISLLEGGINGVIMASLFKPLAKNDQAKISSIVATSKKFFRRISLVFVVYSIGVALAYPMLSNSSFSFAFITTLTLILSIKLFSQYCFSISYQNLLNAGKRGYIISFSKIILIILDVAAVIIVTNTIPNIHLVEIISATIYLIQPLIFSIAVKKHYNIDKSAKPDNELIKSRWDGLSINIAYFIHTNTDITLLTIFADLQTISVYSVYYLVGNGLSKMINAITSAISPSIGNLYAMNDKEELNRKFDLYEYIAFAFVFCFFSIGILLVTPFVMIYTSNITDTNYFQPVFGILMLISEAIYAIRAPYLNLSYNAGKFKDISKHAYIEAALNIIISLILVKPLGLVGIAIGTMTAMLYRTIFHVIYLKKKILHRPISKFIKRFAAFFIPIAPIVVLSFNIFPVTDYSIKEWLIHAIIYGIEIIAAISIISILFFREDLKTLKHYLTHRV